MILDTKTKADIELSSEEYSILQLLKKYEAESVSISLYKFLDEINSKLNIWNAYLYVMKLVNKDLIHLNVDVHDVRILYPKLSRAIENLVITEVNARKDTL